MCLAVAEPASTSSAATDSVVLSGKVTDASGHGWPLYVTITVDGVPGGPFFTDPHTGKYTLRLPPGTTYTIHVNAKYPGYQEQSQTVSPGEANSLKNVNVGLPIDELACTAPAGPWCDCLAASIPQATAWRRSEHACASRRRATWRQMVAASSAMRPSPFSAGDLGVEPAAGVSSEGSRGPADWTPFICILLIDDERAPGVHLGG
jgi:hypothetical protein